MEEKNYYLTNTLGDGTFNKIFMYLDGNNIKFIDSTSSDINVDLSQKKKDHEEYNKEFLDKLDKPMEAEEKHSGCGLCQKI